jgi:surface antigen
MSHLKNIPLAILLGAIGTVAEARWSHWLPQLEQEDLELVKNTARVQMNGKKVGTTLSWSNNKTGNSGTVTLIEIFEDKGRKCRTNRHEIRQQAQAPRVHTVSICQNADGTWQIVPRNSGK